MDNQSSKGGSTNSTKKGGENLVDEEIDERILRLLELEYIFDIDYDTYASLLKEKMVASRMEKTQIPTEEAELLTNEYKKIKGKKGRFKVKKITADSFKKGSAVGINLGKQNLLIEKSRLALSPAPDKMTEGDDIKQIIDALAEIIKSLTIQNKLTKSAAEKSRIAGEARQRGERESRLEKGFKSAIKVAEKIIAPIKSLLQRIIDFFVTIFIGRALIKLLDWFSDKKNQEKIRAIGRFLGDHWPKLLALYIIFGTGLGKFVRSLTKIIFRGGTRLATAAVGLAAKAGVGKAKGAAKFLGKYGKLIGTGLEVAATVGTTMAVSKGIEDFGGIGEEEKPKDPKAQGLAGGGFVIPRFSGGGFNLKGMMGGAGMGSMFGPLGMLLGGALGSGKPQEIFSGFVSGEKGVDKVPAMLSDGEFVMSRGAVQKYGVDTLESMNAAGGGTNRPKMMGGKTYAAGGGMVGNIPQDDKKERVVDPILKKRQKNINDNKKPTSIITKPSLSITPKVQGPRLSPIELKFAARAKQRGITDPVELKAFLTQVKHESGGNFGEPQREKYNSSPNDPPGKPGYEYFKGYANPALGLGNRNADDAYNYIGRGYLQVTGRTNYEDIGKRIGKDLVGNPNLLMDKDIALDASIEYWKRSVRPNVKNWNNTFEVSRAINNPSAVSPSDVVGMSDRENIFQEYNVIPNKTFTNLKADVATKPKPIIKNQPNIFQKFGSAISSIITPPSLAMTMKSSESSKLNPAQIQTKNNVPRITPLPKPKPRVVYETTSADTPKSNSSSGASPRVPSFSSTHPNPENRRQLLATLGIK
jgi:putative chitinase